MNFTLKNVSCWKWINQGKKNQKHKLSILDNISLKISGINIHAIVGPSGSGKTTLLRLLNKLESPNSGDIYLGDQNLTQIPSKNLRNKVGMVFQVPALFDGKILDNILFGPRLNKLNDSIDKAQELLNIVGLHDIDLHRDAASLSIGQQQRVSFARGLANQPKILLLDELTSALDPTAASNLLDLTLKINKEMGIKIIFVTHILYHAKYIADDVCLLIDGKVEEHSLAQDFFKNPQTVVGQNFIDGKL